VHGDVHASNLLVQDGRLCAVLDFGQLGVGDPACDLVVAWTLFSGSSRESFRAALPLDAGTWARARAWALWKALILAAGVASGNAADTARCWHVIDEVLADHRRAA
jgi:aminoglycoside phosphotransferase (APT) family kinase protein